MSQARDNMDQWVVADATAPVTTIASDILDRVSMLIEGRELSQANGLVQRSFPMGGT